MGYGLKDKAMGLFGGAPVESFGKEYQALRPQVTPNASPEIRKKVADFTQRASKFQGEGKGQVMSMATFLKGGFQPPRQQQPQPVAPAKPVVPESTGMAWYWWVAIVVVVLGAVYFFVFMGSSEESDEEADVEEGK